MSYGYWLYVGILLWFCGCWFILLDLMLMCKSARRSWFHYRKYFRILELCLICVYIHNIIYICMCVSFCSPKMISWTRSSMRTPIFWAMQRTFLVWMYESMIFQCSLNPLHTRSKVRKNLCRHNLDADTTLISNTFWYTISIYQYNMNILFFAMCLLDFCSLPHPGLPIAEDRISPCQWWFWCSRGAWWCGSQVFDLHFTEH